MANIKKPKPISKVQYDWHEVEDYISKKYKLPLKNIEWCCWWHYIIDRYDVHNGSFFTLYTSDDLEYIDEQEDSEKLRQVLEAYQKEFGDEIEFEVSW